MAAKATGAEHDPSLLVADAEQTAYALASRDGAEPPKGPRLEALHLTHWLLQLLAVPVDMHPDDAAIVAAMVKAAHREDLDVQVRYVTACALVEEYAEAFRKASDDKTRGYSVGRLATELYGLDRAFGDYMVTFGALQQGPGPDGLCELLTKWVPDKTKAVKGTTHTTGLLAQMCLETGAFGVQKRPRHPAPAYVKAKNDLTRLISTKANKVTRR